jgi:dethiobiotin synthetase
MRQTWKESKMSAYFVTATGTDIGKTYVTAGLIRASGAKAIKPVMSGFDETAPAGSDAGMLLAAMGREITLANIAAIAPWRYAAPLSPDMAAAREGGAIDFEALLTFCRQAGPVLVEGVGGVMVPLNDRHTVLDWISALKLPVILVAGTYLGTISHILTAAHAVAAADIPIATIVLNESETSPVPPAETAATVTRFLPNIPIHIIPRDAGDATFTDLAGFLYEKAGA